MNYITGIVLSGGKSKRFGQDKGLYLYRGKPLVSNAIDILSKNFNQIFISTNSGKAYSHLGLTAIEDIYRDCGPLGGIHAALKAVSQLPLHDDKKAVEYRQQSVKNESPEENDLITDDKNNLRGIAVISCDTPFIPTELYVFMLENLKGFEAVVPMHHDLSETTTAIYTTACLPHFEQAIHDRRFRILDALKNAKTLYLDISREDFYAKEIFHNINHKRDLPDDLSVPE